MPRMPDSFRDNGNQSKASRGARSRITGTGRGARGTRQAAIRDGGSRRGSDRDYDKHGMPLR